VSVRPRKAEANYTAYLVGLDFVMPKPYEDAMRVQTQPTGVGDHSSYLTLLAPETLKRMMAHPAVTRWHK
jgi:hypothetical protein